jgi:hypothetical protein
MFQVGVVDHVRLSCESLEAACEAHADAAARLTRFSTLFRLLTLAVIGIAAIIGTLAIDRSQRWEIAAAMVTAAAFVLCAAYVAFDQQPRIYGHRASAARLWMVCEKYRALLAEIEAGAVDLPGVGARRTTLVQEAAAIFEQTAPHDRYTFEIARRALRGRAVTPGTQVPPSSADAAA